MLIVEASSAGFNGGNEACITLNGLPVYVEKNEHNHERGLHIVVFNPFLGMIESAKVFDTYQTSRGHDSFDAYITKHIPEGHIVVAACKDECTTQLSEEGKQWFSSMGSTEIQNLKYRCGFVFIGISGRHEAIEKRAMKKKHRVSVTKIFQVNVDSAAQ